MPASSDPLAPIFDRLTQSGNQAVIGTERGAAETGPEFLDLVGRHAAALSSLGLKHGDRVLAHVAKSMPALAFYFATLRIGAVFTSIDCLAPAAILDAVIDDALPALVVASRSTLETRARKLRNSRVRNAMTMEIDGSGDFSEMARGQHPARAGAGLRPSEMAMLAYARSTDGDTVHGAKLSLGALGRQFAMVQQHFALRPTDVVAHALGNWSDPAALAIAGAAFASGARLLWLDGGQATRREATTVLFADEPGDAALRDCTPMLRVALCAVRQTATTLHPHFVSLPETGMLAASDAARGPQLLPGIVARLRDQAGDLVDTPGVGLLEVSGEHVFTGYWRQASATDAAISRDGYFATGLAAQRLHDGSIVLGPQP